MTERSLRIRELYCPAHFGNEYEVAMPREMREILREARYWGFNRYADWFDTIDLADVYARDAGRFDLPEAIWARKFEHFTTAASLGYDLCLVITPNHVFSNQVTPANAAEQGGHVFGQLVCPSKPGVVEMILDNYVRLFADFAKRGLQLSAISLGAYDYGGCLCEACQPWILTFGNLARGILDVARQIFGDIDGDIWGWWWRDEDHADFSAWADAHAPDYFHGFAHHIKYGETTYAERPIPAGCGARAFVHIGYGERAGTPDVYGHYGPAIAPVRIAATVESLFDRRADGFLAYSEGFFDDVNKALLAGLGSGYYETPEALLTDYADRYLGGDGEAWSAWLADIADVTTADPVDLRLRFTPLAASARPSWRLDQLAGKLAMLEADAAVTRANAWNSQRRQAAETFFAAKEHLWRHVWRRGLGRHVFRFDWQVPAWYKEFAPSGQSATEA